MNDAERMLIRYVCEGEIRKAQDQASIVLDTIKSQKDERFVQSMKTKLSMKKPELVEVPYNIKEFVIAENSETFPINRYYIRKTEDEAAEKILQIKKAADVLFKKGIAYAPTLMLYGEPGTGKTMLARYIAYKAGLPFIYVKLSGIINSYLGGTNQNIAKVFDYARFSPCVLCLDEIDAIAMARGQKNEVGEINRVVITLMQELDRCSNDMIIIGTTNRFDRLDEALISRFKKSYHIRPLTENEAYNIAFKFLASVGYSDEDANEFSSSISASNTTARKITDLCTEKLITDELNNIDKEMVV